MKKLNKKGFTIVELVIVIAVIAILAAVMIPTFGGIIKSANESAETQNVTNAYKQAYAAALADDGVVDDDEMTVTVNNVTYAFTMTNENNGTATGKSDYTYKCENGKWTATQSANP